MPTDALPNGPGTHDRRPPCCAARRSSIAAWTLGVVIACTAAVAVLYGASRLGETAPGTSDSTTTALARRESPCSDAAGVCAPAVASARRRGCLTPVASQETSDDAIDHRAAEDAATRFDEQCRPLPAVAVDRRDEAATPSAPEIAPTPAPPNLARSEPQRFVLMVDVEAQHDPGARP